MSYPRDFGHVMVYTYIYVYKALVLKREYQSLRFSLNYWPQLILGWEYPINVLLGLMEISREQKSSTFKNVWYYVYIYILLHSMVDNNFVIYIRRTSKGVSQRLDKPQTNNLRVCDLSPESVWGRNRRHCTCYSCQCQRHPTPRRTAGGWSCL